MLMPAQRLALTLGLAIVTAFAPLAGAAQAQIPDIQLAQPKYAAIVVDAGQDHDALPGLRRPGRRSVEA